MTQVSKEVKFIKTYYYKDVRISQYEYRGYPYYITFDQYGNYNGIYRDIKGEHKAAQDQIDARIEKEENKVPYSYEKSAEYAFDLFHKYCDED